MRRADLSAAVAEGVLDVSAAGRLEAFLVARGVWPDGPDAERGEVVDVARNFNEVFVTLGILLVLSGPAVLGFVIAAVPLAWLIAEAVRALRPGLRLPMLVLAVAFVLATLYAVLSGFGEDPLFPGGSDAAPVVLAGLAGAAASALFGLRFRTPISAGGIAGGLGTALVGGLPLLAGDAAGDWENATILLFGLVVAGVGIAVDARDPQRRSRVSDAAFWLHLVAAPLIVHGAMGLIGLGFLETSGIDGLQVAAVFAIFVLLVAVTLAIDRRAPLVSALSYLAISIGWIAHQADFSVEGATALAAVLVGSVVLIMGVFWEAARRGVLSLVPDGRVKAALPPAAPAPSRVNSGSSAP